MANRRAASGLAVAVPLPQQLRQPRHVDGNPPRFVLRENLRLPCFVFVVARIDVRERLPVGVTDDIATRNFVGTPGRREAAGARSARLRYGCCAPAERRTSDSRHPTSHPSPDRGASVVSQLFAVTWPPLLRRGFFVFGNPVWGRARGRRWGTRPDAPHYQLAAPNPCSDRVMAIEGGPPKLLSGSAARRPVWRTVG
jgi:hypothetical protein